jgi:autoinducer 2-degrading protein
LSYVIAATYVANEGEAEGVLAALKEMTPLTRAEPGCEEYVPHRSLEDPNVFFLYERYRDPEAFAAHAGSEYFERLIKGEAWPRLAHREVVRAAPLEDA